jgi:poly-gamma-glutamate synthesis protein (capsule biosynthesis protein)
MVRIAFFGDTLLGGVGQETIDRFGYGYPLEGLAPLLAGVDLVVANHEGPLTSLERPATKLDTGRKRYWYRGLPEAASALAEAGVKMVSLANNHIMDFGIEGLADTIQALDAAGIAHTGAGLDENAARRPAILSVGGSRIGFLSLMQRYDLYEREGLYALGKRGGPRRVRLRQVREDFEMLKGMSDLRIALVHWGRNYRAVTSRQRRLATALRERGADLVIGHHPHIAQPIDLDTGKPVLYSLGNGPLGTPGRFHSGRPPYGLVATVEIDGAAISRLDVRLIAVDNARVQFRPVPEDGPEAKRFLWSLVSQEQRWQQSSEGGLRAELLGRSATGGSPIRQEAAAGT